MARYKEAVDWIAFNDNAGSEDQCEDIQGYITVALVADIFGKEDSKVAADVARVRAKYYRE